MAKELIRLENLVKVYDDKTILKSINLYINDTEFLTLLGPSGCGKTTTLRLIGGFETPTSGVVYFDGVNVNQVPPHRRQVNTVFQKYALFPHLNVFDNIAFGLRIPRRDRAERQQEKLSESQIRQRVLDTLKLVGLQGYEHRSVTRLSGGEQQRVAIARAVAVRPKVLLLDEPLGALDLKLRKEMQTELKRFQQQLGITFIYVTHDQEEALTMSDTIVVMNRGKIQQVGRPTDIYNEPKNAFVADFIGESNILDGVMRQDRVAEFAGRIFPCVDEGFAPDEPVDVVLRPEDLHLVDAERAQMSGTVESVVFKGVHYEMMVRTDAFTYMVHSTQYRQVGDQVGLYVQPSDIHIMHKPRQEDEKEETPV